VRSACSALATIAAMMASAPSRGVRRSSRAPIEGIVGLASSTVATTLRIDVPPRSMPR
jgi:hypothetical protein